MHAVPEKLSALRESFEATLTRQMFDYRLEFEKKLKEHCRIAEDNAVRRSEEHLLPRQNQVSDELKVHLRSTQAKNDEAIAKASHIADQQAGLHAEVQPLHARADATSARLDRLAVQTATTTKDTVDMGVELRAAVVELRSCIADEGQRRRELETVVKAQIEQAAGIAREANAEAIHRATEQHQFAIQFSKSAEERLAKRLDEQAERSLKESKLGDQDVLKELRPEIASAVALAERKAEESMERAEMLVRSTVTHLREELDTLCKRTKVDCDSFTDKLVNELSTKLSEGLELVNKSMSRNKSNFDQALQEATTSFRKSITETRAGYAAEAERIRHEVAAVDTRFTLGLEDSERRAVEAASRRLEEAAATLSRKIAEVQDAQVVADSALKQDQEERLEQTCVRIDRTIKDAASSCNGLMNSTVSQASAQLRAEFADGFRSANERTDTARCVAAEQLRVEVEARQAALAAADSAREAFGAALRDELRTAAQDLSANAKSLSAGVDRRVDSTNAELRSLDRSLEAFQKEHTETIAFLRSQLKAERQQTEEANAEVNRLLVQTRDSLEGHVQNDVHDLRAAVAECRKRLGEEADGLRHELRQQPTKREVAEGMSAVNERCTELAKALDSYRARLEGAVQDFSTRCRDVSGEASEARLRMQRETMTLGHEITQLKSAASSLANGVIKALNVIGLVRPEETGGFEATPLAKPPEDGAEIKTRAIEVEDLLQWEKIGKSLSSRISRQWYHREMAGYPTVLSMLDGKASQEDFKTTLGSTVAGLPPSMASTCASPIVGTVPSGTGIAVVPHAPPGHSKGESPKVRQQKFLVQEAAVQAAN
eukprot:TRINITY_DN48407_c0_g1_i1.p1 TRINITY_DN48407_c0_g1~~TRINITY_DN48407_c0_g1_i1.p1  ORF type:complete len:832 (+),score=195.37 TRINITY_DN48407_c0_g1_i1:120-2615(+)